MKYNAALQALVTTYGLTDAKAIQVLNHITHYEGKEEVQRSALILGADMGKAEADIFLAQYEMTKPFVCEGRR